MDIYDEIKAERTQQDAKYGGPSHDDTHVTEDWTRYIHEHAARTVSSDDEKVRRQLIRVAALAVAAVESMDRIGPHEVEGV